MTINIPERLHLYPAGGAFELECPGGGGPVVIYIDPPVWAAHGTAFSHLVSDASLEELHAFAERLGVSERAFDRDHYDVPQRLYDEAVLLGATAVSAATLVRKLRESGLRIPARKRPERLNAVLMNHWRNTHSQDPELGTYLLTRWSEPHRSYHSTSHLLDCLEGIATLSAHNGGSVPSRTLLLGAWFHDAVYDAQPGRDEEESAQLALEHLAVPMNEDVARLVRLTDGHETYAGDVEGQILLDADLRILASPAAEYGRYVDGVRKEYAHVNDEQWRRGRGQVLRGLLGRDHLYFTPWARKNWEPAARRNLEGELEELSGSA